MRVAVIGGGVMGAAAAWRLAKRGVDVVCYDRNSPPHAFGSSHGESRIIRSAYFEGSWYVPLLQEAFAFWRELEATTGMRILTMTGALMIGDASSGVVVGAQASAREHGLSAEFLDSGAFARRYRAHVVHDGDVAVLDPEAGVLNPEAAVAGMLAQWAWIWVMPFAPMTSAKWTVFGKMARDFNSTLGDRQHLATRKPSVRR